MYIKRRDIEGNSDKREGASPSVLSRSRCQGLFFLSLLSSWFFHGFVAQTPQGSLSLLFNFLKQSFIVRCWASIGFLPFPSFSTFCSKFLQQQHLCFGFEVGSSLNFFLKRLGLTLMDSLLEFISFLGRLNSLLNCKV